MTLSTNNWIYETNEANSVRYILGQSGRNTIICIGTNPSTAEPGLLDNTLKSVARLTKQNGFENWIMLNLYAQRATNPVNIHHFPDKKIHKKNLIAIDELLKELELDQIQIWAAWGTLIKSRTWFSEYLRDIYRITMRYDCKWATIGDLTKDGHPRHPLYLKSTSQLRPFLISQYLKKLGNL